MGTYERRDDMANPMFIKPLEYVAFQEETEQLEQCKEWGLLSGKTSKTKSFSYKGGGVNRPCTLVGYVDKITAVIELENGQLHCIHPSYLKEMQTSSFGQRGTVASPESAEAELSESGTYTEPAMPAEESVSDVSSPLAPVVVAAPAPAKPAAKKEKASKPQLPEEKVRMTAVVKEFTTVPNNFSDTDDEVIIYESAAIVDPAMEIGDVWSSHSATIKKLELNIGDSISFEAKIVKKKLTKHPVPYKINNPSKIIKS
jgi:hypothetical protein